MKNRIAGYLPALRSTGQSPKAAIPELRQSAHEKNAIRTGDVEWYVKEHPLVAISAAFCIGVFLAWMIKRR